MLKILKNIWSIPDLRRRITVVFGCLVIYRVGFHVYLPGVDLAALGRIIERITETQGQGLMTFFNMTSQLTGGQLNKATIFSLGIMPYISASIIFSLLVKVFPRLEAMQKEGESGRQQINRYTRYSTVVLCVIQALIVVKFLHTPFEGEPISRSGLGAAGMQVLVLTGGTLFLMWLGEKMTEYGIGNGVSLIIMAGILARMPGGLFGMFASIANASEDDRPFEALKLISIVVLFIVIVLGVVYITRGQRRIPVQQARTTKGSKSFGGQRQYMPIRVNSAGVLPIIFAQSLMMIPAGLVQALIGGGWFTDLFAFGTYSYMFIYVALIGVFAFFWTSLMFNPVEISQNMKEHGSFIPGIRPGRRTAEYLEAIINRITLAGATFLSIIAITPMLITRTLNVGMMMSSMLGGTGILIVVGVALDLVDKIEAQLLVREYEGFVKGGVIKGGAGNALSGTGAGRTS